MASFTVHSDHRTIAPTNIVNLVAKEKAHASRLVRIEKVIRAGTLPQNPRPQPGLRATPLPVR